MTSDNLAVSYDDGTEPQVLFGKPGYNNPPPFENKRAHDAVVLTLLGLFLPIADLGGVIMGLFGLSWAHQHSGLGASRCWAAVIGGTISFFLKGALFLAIYLSFSS